MAIFALIAFFLGFLAFNVSLEPSDSESEPTMTLAPSTGRAVLEVRAIRPLTIAGRGFKARESVRITGAGPTRVTASHKGTFLTRLGGGDPCASLTITAVGSKGSRATLNYSNLSNVHCLDPP